MPGSWNEPAIEAEAKSIITVAGRFRGVRVPQHWPVGSQVRLLLLPPEPADTGARPANGHLKNP